MDETQKRIVLMKPNIGENELELVTQVFESGYLVEGDMVREFERIVAEYMEVKHTIACTSATTGLELSLRALGVGKGDEVIVPDFTHPATALVVIAVGAEPVLVDVNLDTRNTDVEKIEKAITHRTKAVIPVSIFGHPLDIDPINRVADKHGITVIDDAACSLGSEYMGKPVGGLTDISVFSFHPRKIFSCGDGGLIALNNDELAKSIISMKNFGSWETKEGRPGFVNWGTNYRMSNIHGAILLGQIRRLEEIVNNRVEKAKIYNVLLENIEDVVLPTIKPYASSNYQTYTLYIGKEGLRDKIIEEMRHQNIQTQIGTYALHLQPIFTNTRKVGKLTNSRKLFLNLLALPLHHELTYNDQVRVVSVLSKILKSH